MILTSNKIADHLENQTPKGDPLVITPRPCVKKMQSEVSGSVDLRLGCWFTMLRHTRTSMLDIGPNITETLSAEASTKHHFVRFGGNFILHPRSFVLGVTLEWIRLPKTLAGYVTSRSSWGRRGLIIATATGVHPGFIGCLTLELFNSGEVPIALYPGMAISQFFMHTVEGETKNVARSELAARRRPLLNAIELDDFAKNLTRTD